MKPEYFYDELNHKLSCYSYTHFIHTLAHLEMSKEINPSKTLRHARWTIQHKDGSVTSYYGWPTFFDALKYKYGLNIDLHKSSVNGETMVLVFNGDVPFKPEVEEDVIPEQVESQAPKEDLFADFWAVQDDNHKREAKDALAKMAKDRHGVTLNKRLIFDEMMNELIAAVSEM